jgi:hypothetical protein
MEHYYGNKYELKEKVITAIREIGVIKPACKKAGISTSTFYRWMQNDGKFVGDFYEASLGCLEVNMEVLKGIPKQKRHMGIWLSLQEEEEKDLKAREEYRKYERERGWLREEPIQENQNKGLGLGMSGAV